MPDHSFDQLWVDSARNKAPVFRLNIIVSKTLAILIVVSMLGVVRDIKINVNVWSTSVQVCVFRQSCCSIYNTNCQFDVI